MNETLLEKAKAVAVTTERIETVLQAVRKDEEKLKRILELRRLRRRLKSKNQKK